MKRLKCSCGAPAICQSDLWPSVYLCYDCYSQVSSYFATRMPETLDNNPLAADLCGLEQHDDRYRIWIIGDSYVCREFYFTNRKLILDKPA